MIFTLAISNNRVKHLVKELGDNVKIIRVGDETTILEVTINTDMDALSLFHAGVYSGLNIQL
mgnify:CR=1 FL=1|jgi:hypothetical protein